MTNRLNPAFVLSPTLSFLSSLRPCGQQSRFTAFVTSTQTSIRVRSVITKYVFMPSRLDCSPGCPCVPENFWRREWTEAESVLVRAPVLQDLSALRGSVVVDDLGMTPHRIGKLYLNLSSTIKIRFGLVSTVTILCFSSRGTDEGVARMNQSSQSTRLPGIRSPP